MRSRAIGIDPLDLGVLDCVLSFYPCSVRWDDKTGMTVRDGWAVQDMA